MKKAILLSSVFAVGAAFAAEVESVNAIGVLKFSTTDRPAVMLVAVPFAGYGSENCNVRVTDLISTSGLPNGTILRAARETQGEYDVWHLENGQWVPSEVVAINDAGQGKISNAGSATDKTIGRGNSVWLDFTNLTEPDTIPGNVTLLGQMPDSGSLALALASGKWSLIGNPGVTASLNLVSSIKNAGVGDKICIQAANGYLTTYTYSSTDSGCWKARVGGKPTKFEAINIKDGEGCWYYAAGDGRSFTF